MSGRRRTALAVVAAALVAAPARGEPGFGTVSTVPVARGQQVRDAVLADVDGDGLDDLVVATRRPGRRTLRSLRVHLRRRGDAAFAPEPDATLDAYDDLVAFAVGNVDPEPGAEIVLFTPGSVHAWRPRAPEDRRVVRLADADFLFQFADPKEVFAFESAVRDVDGDGLPDLLVPEPEGYRVLLQRRGDGASRFGPASLLHVPDDASGEGGETLNERRMKARAARRQIKVALRFDGGGAPGDEPSGDLLTVREAVPAPQLADFDGDGRLDVLAQTVHQLHVWRQAADGTFPAAPGASYDLPVVADRKRRLDVSYSAQTSDLDADRRADVVLFAGDGRSSDVVTQVLVFTQRAGSAASPLFGDEGLPSQFLKLAGFAGTPRLADVDGDGRPDLVASSVRVDALDALAAAANGTLDAEVYVFRNQGGRGPQTFSREPDLRIPVSVRAESLRHGREGLFARLVPDATGDGVRDLLLRDEPTRIRLLMLRDRNGLSVVPQPLFETFVADDAEVRVTDRPGAPPELLVVEDAQVRHVRFR